MLFASARTFALVIYLEGIFRFIYVVFVLQSGKCVTREGLFSTSAMSDKKLDLTVLYTYAHVLLKDE